ncbi:Calmodulin-binding transcription activator 2 [Geodia barretti]|uniref:Calmodulin-binding transcription activator 2 n=1 Tax=Geodia barretti TaxID=519541 RepID=A0AA35XDI9_GEOBA|nr:Calmodulin-binding transcription activator 2 [Geodia barretti]
MSLRHRVEVSFIQKSTSFTDTEQKQLYRAIQIIQNTFRKFKTQWQQLPRVEDRQKYAALLIENYYTRYRQLKQQQDRAARRIQHNYRMYRNRSREMNRAALFIQQMYRFHRIKRQQPDAMSTIRSPPFQHIITTPVTTTQN